jgi:hypothetical protein
MLQIRLDLPDEVATFVAERAEAHGTTPETYLLALLQRVVLEDALGNRRRRLERRILAALQDDVPLPTRRTGQ